MSQPLFVRVPTQTRVNVRAVAKHAGLAMAPTVQAMLDHLTGEENPLWPAVEQALKTFKENQHVA